MNAKELRRRARASLAGEYGYALLATVIVSSLSSIVSGITAVGTYKDMIVQLSRYGISNFDISNFQVGFHPASSLLSLAGVVLLAPLGIGLANYFVHLADRNNPNLGHLFQPYHYFAKSLGLSLMIGVFTFLWSLLFIIPGIIAAFRYAMAPYILAEHPEMQPSEALNLSKQMMKDNCGRLFCLELSFFGWFLLCCLTFGIGFLFLSPYIYAAQAQFFNEVSGKNIQKMQEAAAAANGYADVTSETQAEYAPYTPAAPAEQPPASEPAANIPYQAEPAAPQEVPYTPVQPEAPEVPDVPETPETDETRPES